MARLWCKAQHGRQAYLAKVLDLSPSVISDCLNSKRAFTAEQILGVQEFLKTVHAPDAAPADVASEPPRKPVTQDDPLQALHAGLDDPQSKSIWVRPVGNYRHIIVGGPARDKAIKRIVEILRTDKVLAQIVKDRTP